MRCSVSNTGTYSCTLHHADNATTVELGGDRAYSENLLVAGSWYATVTGLDELTIPGTITDAEVRLRGLGWDGPGGFATVTCAPPARALAPLEPASGALIGAYPASRSSGFLSSQQAVAELEALTDARLDIVQVFNPPHQPEFQVDLANLYLSQNRIPLITWKIGPTSWPEQGDRIADRVIAGEFDSQIRARAAEARRIEGPFFSRLFHEPDGAYGVAYDLTPENSRAYWQRIRSIFEAEGVTNAVWVWTAARLEADEFGFYPGDDLVDWIGADPYLWIGDAGAARCQGDGLVYEPLIDRLGSAFWQFAAEHPDKPIMLAEWGTGWQADSDIRTRFIDSAKDAVLAEPRIKALVYFNSSPSGSCDWTLTNGGAEGIEAFGRLLNDADLDVDVAALLATWVA